MCVFEKKKTGASRLRREAPQARIFSCLSESFLDWSIDSPAPNQQFYCCRGRRDSTYAGSASPNFVASALWMALVTTASVAASSQHGSHALAGVWLLNRRLQARILRVHCDLNHASGPVAQWIRHRPTEPGIAGSSPAGVILLLFQI